MEKNLYYFLSDVHLGLRHGDYIQREREFAGFLESLPHNTRALYLLGDIFDFWYEYKYVIPRGVTRTLGALAALKDRGVDVFFFKGNHDVWAFNYFEQELGIKVLPQPSIVTIEGTTFCLGHGDGLGTTPLGFRFIRWCFHNRFLQFLFSAIHPRWAFGLGYSWSRHTRLAKTNGDSGSSSVAFDWKQMPIYHFADDYGKYLKDSSSKGVDYYIFGHFHSHTKIDIPSGGEMHILGEWINVKDYLCFDGHSLQYHLVSEENR